MHERHFLLADDIDETKICRMRDTLEKNPRNRVHVARTTDEAKRIADQFGERLMGAAIDFDFFGEGENGAGVIRHINETSRGNAKAVCVTARPRGGGFEEASALVAAAGGITSFTSTEEFEGEMGCVLAA